MPCRRAGLRPAFALSSENLPTMPDPTLTGEAADMPAGTDALEHQEGSKDQHFGCRTAHREEPSDSCETSTTRTRRGNAVTCGSRSAQEGLTGPNVNVGSTPRPRGLHPPKPWGLRGSHRNRNDE